MSKSKKIIEIAQYFGIKDKLRGAGGRLLAAFVILLIGLNAMAQKSTRNAKEELILRGLLDPLDL
jgi:hypothetical protein